MRQSSSSPAISTGGPTSAFGLYRPLRETHWPDRKLVATAPSISGVRTTPESVADVPITPCTNRGTNEIVPNIANPTRPIESTLDVTVEDARIRSNGSTGSGTRRSHQAKTASSTAATESAPSTWPDSHEYSRPPQTSPSSSAHDPSARIPPPVQSTECSRFSARRGIVR